MDMGYPLHLFNLLAKLYRKQLAKCKVVGTLSEWFHIMKGVQQACVFSAYICLQSPKRKIGFDGASSFRYFYCFSYKAIFMSIQVIIFMSLTYWPNCTGNCLRYIEIWIENCRF